MSENTAERVTQSLANYAFPLLKKNNLKAMVMVEDEDGNRFWSASGKLRAEFLNELRLENRPWGMFEVKRDPTAVAVSSIADYGQREPMAASIGNSHSESGRRIKDVRLVETGHLPDDERDYLGADRRFDVRHGTDGSSNVSFHQMDRSTELGDVNPPREWNRQQQSGGQSIMDYISCTHCGVIGHVAAGCPMIANLQLNSSSATFDNGYHTAMDIPTTGDNVVTNAPKSNPNDIEIINPKYAHLRCHKCDKMGHIAPDCPLLVCYKCDKMGHIAPDCPLRKRPKAMDVPTTGDSVATNAPRSNPNDVKIINPKHARMRCHKCEKIGHIAPDCPLSVKNQLGYGVCFRCGTKGHKVQECPKSGKRPKTTQDDNEEKSKAAKRSPSRASSIMGSPIRETGSPTSKSSEREPQLSPSKEPQLSPSKERESSPRRTLRLKLRELEDRTELRYKWLSNAKRFLIIMPTLTGSSDTLVNIDTMDDLMEASKKLGFTF